MMAASVGDLSTDLLANVFRFLGLKDIMRHRRVNKRWGEAVKKTVPPPLWVDSIVKYNVMGVMTRAMPNLQRIVLKKYLGTGHKYSDGEDPDEEEADLTADYTTHDMEIISNFSKLKDGGPIES